MTLARVRDQARRFTRVYDTWTSGSGVIDDAHLNDLIQDAVRQFVDDCGGIEEEDYLALDADFTTRTTMGFHLLVEDSDGSDLVDADIALTATDRSAVAGSTVASDLQTQIRAATGALGTETVTWTSFYFTLDLKQGTTFTFTAPTSVTLSDARERLGLSNPSTSSTTVTGTFPEDCTLTVALPTDVVTFERVEWDGRELAQMPREWSQSPEANGTPRFYSIRNRQLYLYPTPTEQEALHVWYRGQPTDIDFDSDTDLPSGIPSAYHMAIPHLVAGYVYYEVQDEKRAMYHQGEYRRYLNMYITHRENMSTEVDDNLGEPSRLPRVTMPSN